MRRIYQPIELLERRLFLAGQFPALINFQPAGAPIPTGYLADTGAAFGGRGNNWSYGWDQDLSAATRDRNVNADQRYDTLIHTQQNNVNRVWQMDVPSGAYDVRLVAGDPSYFDSVYKFAIENVAGTSGTPSSGNRFFDSTVRVNVNDGKLTIANASGSWNNKIAFVEIKVAPTSPPPPPPPSPPPPPPPPGQTPFGAVPRIAGLIEAENFDNGGSGVAWSDVTAGNAGNAYRFTDVDIQPTSDTSGGYNIGWTRPGEWLEYTVDVDATANYNLDVRVASATGGAFHLEFDGANKTGSITLPNTGGWTTWKTITKTGISLAAGRHVMRLAFDSGAVSGQDIGNINWLRLNAATPTPTVWSDAAPSPVARFESNNAAVNGKLYVFGGYDKSINAFTRSDVYDPGANAWTQIADMPEPTTHSGTAVDGNIVYIAGGFVGSGAHQATANVWKYDTVANTWTAGLALPAARGAGGLVRVGRILHFFGGGDSNHVHDFGDHWTLNLDGGTTWLPAPALPNPRNHFGYAELGGKAYAIGGQHFSDEAHGNQSDVHVFDPATNAWTAAASLPFARSHNHTSTFLFNGKLGIVGGQANGTTGPVTIADVLLYDPAANKWSSLPSLPEPRQATVAQAINGDLIVTTGTPQGIDPKTNTWRMKVAPP